MSSLLLFRVVAGLTRFAPIGVLRTAAAPDTPEVVVEVELAGLALADVTSKVIEELQEAAAASLGLPAGTNVTVQVSEQQDGTLLVSFQVKTQTDAEVQYVVV